MEIKCRIWATGIAPLMATYDKRNINGTSFLLHHSYINKDGKRKINAKPQMMTSSNGNISRVTGHLCGEFTGPGEFPAHKGQWRGALMFSLICVWINGWVNNREAGDLRHYRANYDVTVMQALHQPKLYGEQNTNDESRALQHSIYIYVYGNCQYKVLSLKKLF